MESRVVFRVSPSEDAAQKRIEELIEELQSSPTAGLRSTDADQRRSRYGRNVMPASAKESLVLKFVKMFKDPLIALLLASALISVCFKQYDDAASIAIAVTIVVTVAFVQEYRSEQALEALNTLVPHRCNCLRDGVVSDILASELVPGDIVVFASGDRVPADVRLIEATDFSVNESSLTGETNPVYKQCDVITRPSQQQSLGIPERTNIAFLGTLACNGHARALVVATGAESEFGEVYRMIDEVEDRQTPLQLKMEELGRKLTIFSFGVIGVIVVIGMLQRRRFIEMFTIGVGLAVAAIPEGLPIVVTVTLALGVLRMARRNAIVKRLPAVEALGVASVVCCDKTGTLTRNEMTVALLHAAGSEQSAVVTGSGYDPSMGEVLVGGVRADVNVHRHLTNLLTVGSLCNNARLGDGSVVGQPTEGAILVAARKMGLNDPRETQYLREVELPFNPERKWMGVVCKRRDGHGSARWYVKGATSVLLSMCSTYEDAKTGGKLPMDDAARAQLHEVARVIGRQGLRVLALATGAYTPVSGVAPAKQEPSALAFVGFAGLLDPPREDVRDAVARMSRAGVSVVMITGDSLETAESVAEQVGIIGERSNHGGMATQSMGMSMSPSKGGVEYSQCLSGAQVRTLHSSHQLATAVRHARVFYRTSPHDKLAIVQAYQANGSVVAMTGDGVNDAPALRRADIGIAMGLTGKDVCKEAADMILLNDDFLTIMSAIEEGKSIFYNITNFVCFQLSTSIAALSLITISTCMGVPNPMNAMQILWINIIMDGPPAQSLGVEPVDRDVMLRPPRNPNAAIIDRPLLARVLVSASLIVAGTLFIYVREMGDDTPSTARDRTMAFTTFVFFDMFNALACRSQSKSVLEIGIFSNRPFVVAVGISILMQFAVIYVPLFQYIFQTEPLSLADILLATVVASSVLLVSEARKWSAADSRHSHSPIRHM